MKEYKLVYLNKGIKFSREKDMEQAEEIINEYVSAGWELQQMVSLIKMLPCHAHRIIMKKDMKNSKLESVNPLLFIYLTS